MKAADTLRQRAAQYRRLGLFAALVGLAGLLLAIAFWMPWWRSSTAFRHIAIDWHIEGWWSSYVTRLHHAGEATDLVALNIAFTLTGLVLGPAGFVMLCLRRRRLAAALIVFAGLGIVVPQGINRRGEPQIYAETTEVTPAVAARLHDVVATPAGLAQAFHQMQYPSWLNHGTFAVNWGGDGFDLNAVAPEIHYILAQRAYLAGNAAETQAQLEAIDPGHVPLTFTNAYRLNTMRDWVAACGHSARGEAYATPFPSTPEAWHRPLSWGGLALAIVAFVLALASLALSSVVLRRAGRIETYAVRLLRSTG